MKITYAVIFVCLILCTPTLAQKKVPSGGPVPETRVVPDPGPLGKLPSLGPEMAATTAEIPSVAAFPPIQHKVLTIIYDTHTNHPTRPYWNPVELNSLLVTALEQASVEKAYLGRPEYANHSPNIDLQLVNVIVHTTPSPLKPGQTGSGAADYIKIFEDHDICAMVNEGSVDEVWLWADRDGGYWEATMIGPADQIFNTNSEPIDPGQYPNTCQRGVHIMGFNYEIYYDRNDQRYQIPSPVKALHSFGHRAENTLAKFLDGKNRDTVTDGDTYFEFEGQQGYDEPPRQKGYAGNTHFPPNGLAHYDYSNCRLHLSDYLDWTPQHSLPRTDINCRQWDCFEEQYHKQWFQNMPGRCMSWNMAKANRNPMPNVPPTPDGDPMPDWWYILLKSQLVDHTTPCPPAPPVVSLTKSGGTVILNWQPTGVRITSYGVERCAGAGCTNFSEIGRPSMPSFTDNNVAVGTSYRYRVRAFNGVWSEYSAIVDAYPPGVPDAFHVVLQNQTVALSWWPSVPAAMSYLIERCPNWDCANFTQIGTSPTTGYIDSTAVPGTYYRYRVRAYDGLYSQYTAELSSFAAWGIRVRPVCKGGTVSTQATSAAVALWPPNPLTFRIDPYKPGVYVVSIQSNDSDNSVYLGLRAPSGEWLRPTGTPPHPSMLYSTFFNPPTPMVRWNRNELPVGVRWYTVDFEATSAMCECAGCAVPAEEEEPQGKEP